MNVTRLGNQDNRTNFNSWLQFKNGGSKIEIKDPNVDRAFLHEIEQKVCSVLRDKNTRAYRNAGYNVLEIDGGKVTRIWYNEDGGLGIINYGPEFLQPHSWECNINEVEGNVALAKFREVKTKLGGLISRLLDM